MKIYFAGSGPKVRNKTLYKYGANRLFSFFILSDPNSGYGDEDRFKDLIKWIFGK